MTNPTSNFGWQMPTSTDLVTDLPADFEVFGQAVDTDFVDLLGGTTGQVLSKTSATDLDFTWVTTDDTNAIQNAIVDAKGDLIGATAADTPARLAVGANNTVLTADSAEATGLKWATPSTSLTWTDWTPTITQSASTISKTINWARYIQAGKIVWVTMNCEATSAGTASNRVLVSFPSGLTPKYTSSNGLYPEYGIGHVYDQSANLMYRALVRDDGGKFALQPTASTQNNDLGATDFTAAIASGDRIGFSLWYEVA